MTAATRGAAEDAETTFGPWSPELVLVSPELRESALRALALPHERNGVIPSPLKPAEDRSGALEREPSILRAAAVAAIRTAVLSGALVMAVAAAAFGLTVAPDGTEPKLAPRFPGEAQPESFAPVVQPVTPSIGTAVATHEPIPTTSRGPTVDRLRLVRMKRAPTLRRRAAALKVGASYVSCGGERWIAAAADGTLSCRRERQKPRR
jgi:hypothetical protein